MNEGLKVEDDPATPQGGWPSWPQRAPRPTKPARRRGRGRAIAVWTRDILVSLAVAFFIITFIYQPVRVEGTSMQPRLHDQDRIFINKFAYHFEDISRGDVVVFNYPRDPSKSYIKRVIALPGDRLEVDDGRVYVNGVRIREPYVPQRFRDSRSVPAIILPPNNFFVMGDHRSISSDSRDFGPVDRSFIYGKAAFVYWPTDMMHVVE